MKGAAAAALALGVVLPMALARGFSGGDGDGAARERAPEVQRQTKQSTGMAVLIYTAAPVYASLAALRGEERFPQGAELRVLRGGKSEPLVTGFAASADASVSFDGKAVLFAGKKGAGDRWRIWQMPMEGGASRLVYGGHGDAIRPLWMPDGRVVFAERGAEGFELVTTALDGTAPLRLTYLPGNFIPDDVLRDGRVLFESGSPLGVGTTPELYLVYPDGSGVESVRCDHGNAAKHGGREHGRQMAAGDVVFTHGRQLARFTSALAEEAPIASPAGDFAGDVSELPDKRWLLAVRRPGEKHDVLVAWMPGAKTERVVARDEARDLVEPVIVVPRSMPRTFPSALHPWKTGNLLALDARLSREGALHGVPATVRVETLDGARGRVRELGTAPVMEDGSFFVKVPGDRALRFMLQDAAGRTLRQEQGWFWMRSGEQRICVGCHTGPERAPDNRVPEVLVHSTTPVDLSGAASSIAAGGH
jgi:Hydrazine synthase alpha subunit middle domain